MFSTKNLKAFYFVATQGGLKRASEKMGLGTSTLSEHIRGLETSLGTTLFVRGGDGMRLTYQGDRLLKLAREFLESERKVHKFFEDKESASLYHLVYPWPVLLSQLEDVFSRGLGERLYSGRHKVQLSVEASLSPLKIEEKLAKGIFHFGVLPGTPKMRALNYLALPTLDLKIYKSPHISIAHDWEAFHRDGRPVAISKSDLQLFKHYSVETKNTQLLQNILIMDGPSLMQRLCLEGKVFFASFEDYSMPLAHETQNLPKIPRSLCWSFALENDPEFHSILDRVKSATLTAFASPKRIEREVPAISFS